jgi:hypothetical protein
VDCSSGWPIQTLPCMTKSAYPPIVARSRIESRRLFVIVNEGGKDSHFLWYIFSTDRLRGSTQTSWKSR